LIKSQVDLRVILQKALKINVLPKKRLLTPLDVAIERDADGFIARTMDLPLFAFGEDVVEAVDSLKCEIESLYGDLMEDDNFSEEFLRNKLPRRRAAGYSKSIERPKGRGIKP
jgi:hypothetical protein